MKSTISTQSHKLFCPTQKKIILRCKQQPFFSYDDWFIGSTIVNRGIPKEIINSDKVTLTHNKTISEIIQIINLSDSVIGNESGPICLAASFKKEVHSIYLPIHTKPESKIISNKTIYYNTEKESDEVIINKIMKSLLRRIT